MEELKELMNKYKYSGINVLLFDKDKLLESTSLGYASLENKEPLDLNSIFRIASISKVIIALGIMKLVEEGKININEDISQYLGYDVKNPYFKDKAITIKHLMTQTSSISDGADNIKGYDGVNGPKEEVSLKELLTNPNYKYYTEKTFLNKEPGSYFEYSNFGCGILACIIEKITGKYFNDYIKEILFKPLSIDASFRVDEIINQDKIASLYNYYSNEFKLCRNKEIFKEKLFPLYPLGNNFRGPAGGLFISGLDLMKIGQMLMNKGTYQNIKLFKRETINLMEKEAWRGMTNDSSYKAKGLQLNLLDLSFWPYKNELGLKGHFGDAYGAQTFMFYTSDFGMIFLCSGVESLNSKEGIKEVEYDALKKMISIWEEKYNPKRNLLNQEVIDRIKKFTVDRNYEQFHTGENLAKSLVLEASELLELYQWTNEVKDVNDLKDELADVFVYAIQILNKYNLDINEIILNKMTKNEKKYPVEKAYGKSNKYNEL